MLPENWKDLTPQERLDHRLAVWADTDDKEFATPEAKEAFAASARRMIDVIKLREPDRVPRVLNGGGIVAQHAGMSHGDLFYDDEKAVAAMARFVDDYDLDYQVAGSYYPGRLLDRIGYASYRWPGGTLPEDQPFQAVDDEYMTADDYDQLIADPQYFFITTYLPRVATKLAGLRGWPSGLSTVEIPFLGPTFAAFADPAMREALQALLDAGEISAQFLGHSARIAADSVGHHGLPSLLGGFAKVPLDYVGDTLRGTRAIMLDLYRNPDRLLAACEAFTQPAIDAAVGMANITKNPFIFIVMHKGADGFMSNKNFEKFYLPGFKALLDGLIAEGVVPLNFVEGGYNQRLDILADAGIAPASTLWLFDQTDMAVAKEKIGPWAGIGGNVPSSLFLTATPEQMREDVRELMEVCAPGGGYFLCNGAVMDDGTEENIKAYLQAGRDFGAY